MAGVMAAAAAVERRTRWAAAGISAAAERRAQWAVVDTSAAVACVLVVRPTLAALRTWAHVWAEVGHVSEADRTSAGVISAADQRGRGLAADQREGDLLRDPVSMLSGSMISVRSPRTAQTGTPRSVEITMQQTSAETETRV